MLVACCRGLVDITKVHGEVVGVPKLRKQSKQNTRPFLLAEDPFVLGLEQEVATSSKELFFVSAFAKTSGV